MPQTAKAPAIGTEAELLADLLRRRYRQDPPVTDAPWNTAIDAILDHRTARAYLPDALPESTLELLAAAAQSAPTSSNLQAWSVVAVADSARKARLAQLAGPNKQIEEAPLFLVWIADLARARAIAKQHDAPGDGLDYLESFLLAALDAALAAQNAVVAADSLGLGTCYIGAIRNQPEAVAAELGLPPEAVAVFGLTVGYPDPSRASDVKPRLPQSSVLHREQYGRAVQSDDLAAYNTALRQFQAEQGMPQIDWTELISRRIGTTPALKGREQLTTVLHRLGFKLL
ncbi:NADPH-dependent oxidoreductase [Devosia yakushimensis]|uniref:NADPH-dependent oxidoreductase n=1 Tax=Devosia yakushimensis TaxID=470028 RepID=A0ABQ5UC84_9HYPH|nr:NADPH-dependent oxidoreductase [Devosia yakushimensis]GLQ09464.1 NADPH-dependent oxidoreductase [Devosia yakushimensis]